MGRPNPKSNRVNELEIRIASRRASSGSVTKSPKLQGNKSRSLADAISGRKDRSTANENQRNTRDVISALRNIQNKHKPASKSVSEYRKKSHVDRPRAPPPPPPPIVRASSAQKGQKSRILDAPKGPRATRNDARADESHDKRGRNQPREDDSFSFKNASAPPVLRLSNLANGTSAADVRAVLSQVGRVVDCGIKLMDDQSVTAETVFEHDDHASVAAARFDNTQADGRQIRAIVTKVSTIPGLGSNVVSGIRRAKVVSQPNYIDRWSGPPLYSDYLRAKQR